MINAELLKKAGVNYDEGLTRFMDDAQLYEAVLAAFAEEDTLERARSSLDRRDYQGLQNAVHEAKGSSGNAGLDRIFLQASALNATLRGDDYTEDELIVDFQRFEQVYSEVQHGIRAALGIAL